MASTFANISLYIPHVFANISKNKIVETFEKLRIGSINRIDFVNKKGKNENFNSVYIHFSEWYDNIASRNFQQRVLDPNMEARVVYDEPWFWIVLENKRHKASDRKRSVNLDALNNSQIASESVENPMMTNQDFTKLLEKTYTETQEDFFFEADSRREYSKERCFTQEDAAFITMDDLLEENKNLLEENKNLKLLLGEQIAMSGKLDYKIDILNDEIIALKNHIALLKEDGVYHNL
jgi:hypothetical protein